jgi:hypothetical protein
MAMFCKKLNSWCCQKCNMGADGVNPWPYGKHKIHHFPEDATGCDCAGNKETDDRKPVKNEDRGKVRKRLTIN